MSEEQKNLDVEAGGADLEAEEWSMQSHDPRNQNDIDRERSQEEPLVRTVVIDWEPCDPSNPMHWSSTRKTIAVIAICALAFSVSFSSTVFAPASKQITEEFGVSDIVAKLGVSLYVLGLAIGSLLWGPLSEAYGRMDPMYIALFLFTVFQVPAAVAKNISTLLASRFMSGIAGSAALAIAPAMAVDFQTRSERTLYVNLCVTYTFIGPLVGAIAGAYLTANNGWRWAVWTSLILAGTCSLFAMLVVPESCAEILLKRKAARFRRERHSRTTKSQRDLEPIDFHVLVSEYLTKPFSIFFSDPILLTTTIYASLVYGILYVLMFSLPFSFARARHWSAAQSSLPILAVLIGMLLGSAGTALVDTYWTAPISIRGRRVKPEGRLPQLILSTILLPVGLLWFAWTSSASVPWPVQASSGVLIGAGIVLNPLATTTHFIEMYELHANSALAGCNCCKFVAAAATPLFAVPMFEKLGVQWACSLMAFVCVVFAVFPFLYWRHREMIRNASKWAVESKG